MHDRTDHAVELFEQALQVRAEGDWARAEELCLAAIGIFQEAEGEDSPDGANLLNALTHWREERGDYAGAVDAAQRATRMLDTIELARPEGLASGSSYRRRENRTMRANCFGARWKFSASRFARNIRKRKWRKKIWRG